MNKLKAKNNEETNNIDKAKQEKEDVLTVVARIDDFNVLLLDMESLRGHNLLTNQIITAFMKLIAAQHNAIIFSAEITSEMLGYEMKSHRRLIEKLKNEKLKISSKSLANYDFISGPVYIHPNHWCLFFVSVKSGNVTFINPSRTSRQQAENALARWTTYAEKSSDLSLKKKHWKLSPHWLNHTKQTDSTSCGVFVCFFFETLIKKQYDLLNNHFNIHVSNLEYRDYIRDKIKEAQ